MNRIVWYPNWKHKEAVERLLEKLLELEREDKITLWADEDENGKRFYDIREIENTPNNACAVCVRAQVAQSQHSQQSLHLTAFGAGGEKGKKCFSSLK